MFQAMIMINPRECIEVFQEYSRQISDVNHGKAFLVEFSVKFCSKCPLAISALCPIRLTMWSLKTAIDIVNTLADMGFVGDYDDSNPC